MVVASGCSDERQQNINVTKPEQDSHDANIVHSKKHLKFTEMIMRYMNTS